MTPALKLSQAAPARKLEAAVAMAAKAVWEGPMAPLES